MSNTRQKEHLNQDESKSGIFRTVKQTHQFQRRRKYKAPASHPWRQYKLTAKNLKQDL
jgi:hypothetical protein